MAVRWHSEYRRILLESRNVAMTTLPNNLREAIARIYVQELDRVLLRYELEEINRTMASGLVRDLMDALVRWGARSEIATKRAIVQMIERTTLAHEDAFRLAVESTGSPIRVSFAVVATDAYEQVFLRRSLGMTNSYKTFSRYPLAYRDMVERATGQALLRGDAPREVAQGVMQGLAGGDPYLRQIAEQYGVRGGLRRHARASGSRFDREASIVARRIGSDALRIARSEPQAAYWESQRLASLENPISGGKQIHLSERHPEPDVCDLLVRADIYGLGPGCYPAEYLPVPPHPHCLCYLTDLIRDEAEWDSPKPTFDEPEALTLETARGLMVGAGGKDIEQALRLFRRDTRQAYRVWRQAA
jgi:hypothetical protein